MSKSLTPSKANSSPQVLHNLILENEKQFHIEYGGYLSNHMSHALIALWKLGASSERLQTFFNTYKKVHHLEKRIPSQNFINDSNWKDHIGEKQYYADYVDFFKTKMSKLGRIEMFNEYFPTLSSGLSGSAFHPLIHLGYSIDADDDNDFCEGMAYLAYSYSSRDEPAPMKAVPTEQLDPLEILHHVRQDKVFDTFQHQKKFQETMRSLSKDPFVHQLDLYDLPIYTSSNIDQLLQLLAVGTIQLFTFTGNRDFFLLHGVTSMRAIQLLVPLLHSKDEQIKTLRYYWRALVCTYITQQRPAISKEELPEKPVEKSWNEIIKEVIRLDDEHLIKLVYVCKEEHELYGSLPLFRYCCESAMAKVEQLDWSY